MSFTYTTNLSNDTSRIRMIIGDTVVDAGIRPNGLNFSDEELTGLRALYGSWQAAALAALRIAATQWGNEPASFSVGDYSESNQRAQSLTQLADGLTLTMLGTWSGMGLGASGAPNPAIVT